MVKAINDADGVLDVTDNCILHPNNSQRDTDGDGCGNACDPDFDNNGVVDFLDQQLLQSELDSTTAPDQDLNGDGIVDGTDFDILEDFLGEPAGPSALAL